MIRDCHARVEDGGDGSVELGDNNVNDDWELEDDGGHSSSDGESKGDEPGVKRKRRPRPITRSLTPLSLRLTRVIEEEQDRQLARQVALGHNPAEV